MSVSVEQLAAEAGITPQAVRDLIRRKRIVAEKIAGVWVIGTKSARKFLDTYTPYDTLRKDKDS